MREPILVVYTALFGDYDRLRDPEGDFERVKFVCFTDQTALQSSIWDIRLVSSLGQSSIELNRKYKFLPHQFLSEYDMSFYVDSNVCIKAEASILFNELKRSDHKFALPRHFDRNCSYREAEIIIKSGKAKEEIVVSQMKGYREEGFPENFGLAENNLLFRRHHDPEVIACMELWWKEFQQKSKRDQLSLMYVLWKLKMDFSIGLFSSRRSPYFSLDLHKGFETTYNRMIGYVRFKRFYDSNQPLPTVFDFIDRIYGKLIQFP